MQMKIHHELRATVFALVLVQLISTMGAIVLLSRTGPAVEQILNENDYSLAAVEHMQSILARRPELSEQGAAQADFAKALQRARKNITEREEGPAIKTIEALYPAALGGDREAIHKTVAQLDVLAKINRESMTRADLRAKQLANRGAWASAALALLALGMSIMMLRRANQRLVEPLYELYATTTAWGGGDRLRRCTTTSMPHELAAIGRTLNDLLDARLQHHARDDRDAPPAHDPERQLTRELLVALLDLHEHPLVITSQDGELLVANRAALALEGLSARIEARLPAPSPIQARDDEDEDAEGAAATHDHTPRPLHEDLHAVALPHQRVLLSLGDAPSSASAPDTPDAPDAPSPTDAEDA